MVGAEGGLRGGGNFKEGREFPSRRGMVRRTNKQNGRRRNIRLFKCQT